MCFPILKSRQTGCGIKEKAEFYLCYCVNIHWIQELRRPCIISVLADDDTVFGNIFDKFKGATAHLVKLVS